jgi:hypothetical protein
MDAFWREFVARGLAVLLGLLLGSGVTAFIAWRRRELERQRILSGDARDTVVIQHHLVETAPGPNGETVPKAVRVRSIGQAELDRVVPNGHLARELLKRAHAVTSAETLISMDGVAGSYMLETLTNFVCDRAANGPFEHDLYVMAPCCEPAGIAEYQPISVLLIARDDLALFENWPACRAVEVEHGSDGLRLLSLRSMAVRFRMEQEKLEALREAGQRTRYVETMYVLDLALDRTPFPTPTKAVPWGRFEEILRPLGLE